MGSFFSWLDNSERDRRRALDVIDLFEQKETVDELGIGSVRDTIADQLAPGTSTIQTRARYFFFIPWTYLDVARRPSTLAAPTEAARKAEIALIGELAGSADPAGTIGVMAGASLKRLPSTVYWAGLGRLKFRLTPAGRDQHHRALVRRAKQAEKLRADTLESADRPQADWHPSLPPAPAHFPKGATFQLTRDEARFFREQVRLHAHGSLLHFLIEHGEAVPDITAGWEHEAIATMPGPLAKLLADARRYARLMFGAQLVYNLLLSQHYSPLKLEAGRAPEWIERYDAALGEWATDIAREHEDLVTWNRPYFWAALRQWNPRLPAAVEQFSEAWMNLALASHGSVARSPAAIRLITDRERTLKGPRARLQSPAHLAIWNGASGAVPLNYRWPTTRTIANDVLKGLGAGDA